MNRPPQPHEVLASWVFDEDYDSMQEALTAEWLIEQGLIPDPTQFWFGNSDMELKTAHVFKSEQEDRYYGWWICEDTTK